ncbi:MAG TPA: zinc ABC transporter ATP-binding protein ZnuC [Candidatus Cybelea sp.]|nr:zinc ABC transporter ATP-binding protein ZnuC [Candidatus Cybelea sp.]
MAPVFELPRRSAHPSDAPLVEARSVDVIFGTNQVLHGVDIAIRPGEIVSLIGPNGGGKTTLVRVVLGLLAPTRGKLTHQYGLVVGYVPQRLAIDPILPLTVRRFLTLGGPAGEGSCRAALGEVGLSDLLDQPVQQLSGGELQRTMLARALLRRPQLLVLDEPAQGVDLAGQSDIYNLIARIRDTLGCGVLLVSHDLHLVMAATDTVVCLNHHVCCTGRPEAVRADPAYLALFGAKSATALAVYTHRHDHVHDAADHGHEHTHAEHRHG